MVLVVRPRAFAATPALVALFLFCSTTAIASPASTTGAAVRKWISSEGPSSNGTASLLVTQQEASDESILLKPVSVPKIVGKYCNANRDWGPIPDSPNKDFLGKVVRVVSFIRHGARIMCGGDRKTTPFDSTALLDTTRFPLQEKRNAKCHGLLPLLKARTQEKGTKARRLQHRETTGMERVAWVR
ncbi:unnamed protein product [Amoebophrya sp. A25]|nr:unnamed protein product [Amoebophrya sp. A25]|eukprot:GSA25T00010077001.1